MLQLLRTRGWRGTRHVFHGVTSILPEDMHRAFRICRVGTEICDRDGWTTVLVWVEGVGDKSGGDDSRYNGLQFSDFHIGCFVPRRPRISARLWTAVTQRERSYRFQTPAKKPAIRQALRAELFIARAIRALNKLRQERPSQFAPPELPEYLLLSFL